MAEEFEIRPHYLAKKAQPELAPLADGFPIYIDFKGRNYRQPRDL